ncbi:hypothetical protein VTJ49DRAFT_1600 [Mycothermus thermophilus]|uniref:Uncharacterized protein n=1 Tax=Humicola insolens TaxID=85995 RepID=A0ABR3VCK6_HUMIN
MDPDVATGVGGGLTQSIPRRALFASVVGNHIFVAAPVCAPWPNAESEGFNAPAQVDDIAVAALHQLFLKLCLTDDPYPMSIVSTDADCKAASRDTPDDTIIEIRQATMRHH